MSEVADNWAEGLTPMQRRFCEVYSANGGNALDAARTAQYAHPEKQASRLLDNVGVRAALEKLRESTTNAAIATREERQAFWSKVLRDSEIDMKDRLKASELLGKAQTDFINKTEVTGANGGPVVSEVRIRFVG